MKKNVFSLKKMLLALAGAFVVFFLCAATVNAAERTSIAASTGAPAKGFTVTLKSKSWVYRGGLRIVPTFTVKQGGKILTAGTDYKYWTTNAKAVGTATLSIKGLGSYKGICRIKYKIVRRKAEYISARTRYQTYAYTGVARRPAVVIGFKVGEKIVRLTKGEDYTLKYKNTTYPGTGTVVVRFRGSYRGTAYLSFNIKTPAPGEYPVAKTLSLSAGTVLPDSAVDLANISQYFVSYGIAAEDEVYNRINYKSYRANPNIGLDQLRYLKILHRNYDGKLQVGEIVCNAAIADDLLNIFRELFSASYQLYSVILVDEFWAGDGLSTDEASVRANNTSAFNYRQASDAPNLSNHAFGRAIDINPRHNPYIALRDGVWVTDPYIAYEAGEEGYADPAAREAGLAHAMTASDTCVQIFKRYGFTWGGDWTGASRDYQHFEKQT